jgi:hypothetical protein
MTMMMILPKPTRNTYPKIGNTEHPPALFHLKRGHRWELRTGVLLRITNHLIKGSAHKPGMR